ncbi:hypothetical protein JCM8202v2_006086 [Rhodotorula sphaerocarpa]
MATRAAAAAAYRAAEPTPRKATRTQGQQQSRGLDIRNDDDADEQPMHEHGRLGWAVLQAMKEDFELEAASHLRSLAKNHDERLAALARHFTDTLASLDSRVQSLPLNRYVSAFDCDPERALRTLVEERMRPVAIKDDADVFGTVKKARGGPAPPPSSVKKVPGSAVRASGGNRSARAGAGMSPTSNRRARLRLRPSTNGGPSGNSGATSSGNFVYRVAASGPSGVRGSGDNIAPPTPASAATTAMRATGPRATPRQVRVGESIVMRSVNGSPLGEFVASDVDEDDDVDDEEEGESDASARSGGQERNANDDANDEDDDEDWDLMDKNEASNVEHQSLSKSKKKRAGNKTTQKKKNLDGTASASNKLVKSTSSRSAAAPSASAFSVALPDNAPSFEALKLQWLNDLKAKLRQAELGHAERKRLEEVLVGMADL